jgi:copper chaperone NosL
MDRRGKMSIISRIVIAIAALGLIATYYLPLWNIYMIAPQYPEGLNMWIWLTKITGKVDVINGLNHYIGMKHISEEMFPEFGFMIYIVAFFILIGLTVAITGSRKLLFTYLVLSVITGIAALIDYYIWGYNYGHNLDPSAPIQIPNFSYQPPIIGHKKLLNFDAYSYPAAGGWVVVIATVICFAVWLFEWQRSKNKIRLKKY